MCAFPGRTRARAFLSMSPGLFPLMKRGMVNRSTRFLGLAMMGLWMFVMLGHQHFQRKVAEYQNSSRSLKAMKLRSIGLRKVNYGGVQDKTLVVYVYHESGETYASNFHFFVKVSTPLLILPNCPLRELTCFFCVVLAVSSSIMLSSEWSRAKGKSAGGLYYYHQRRDEARRLLRATSP